MKTFFKSLFGDIEFESKESEWKIETKPHLEGWECPKCGSVYSPFITSCERCANSNIKIITDTTTHGTKF